MDKKDERIAELEREIDRLRAELARFQGAATVAAQAPVVACGFMHPTEIPPAGSFWNPQL